MSETFHKKKKKRSFLQKAKKFGKQGNFGKGRQLSEDEYHYYIRVLEQLKHVEKEEKDTLINNFLREMQKEDKIKSLATNQIVSRILDDTLPIAPISRVIPIIKVFSEDLRIFCVDPFASHVLQTLLTLSLKYIQENATQKKIGDDDTEELIPLSDEEKTEFKNFIIKTFKFVFNNLNEFVCETYASHIVRTVLEVCSGVEVSPSLKCSHKAQTTHSLRNDPKQLLVVPEELASSVPDFVKRLTQLPNFTEVIASECGSSVLQTALSVSSALPGTNTASMLVRHVIEHGFNALNQREGIHSLFEYNATCRLMEATLASATEEEQEEIFESFFSAQIANIATHPLANYSVQRLLSTWKKKESFLMVYDAVCECLKDVLLAKLTGVIHALVQACRNLGSHQSRCLKELMKLLACYDSDASQLKIAPLLLHLLPLDEFEEKKKSYCLPPLSLHGTLILQELLKFNKPIKVVTSILDMPTSDLVEMVCDPRGSHVVDAFAESPFVGEANRGKLVGKLEGNLVNMACSKHGSRSLEALWNVAGMKAKTKICQELFDSSAKLRENKTGLIIYNNFQVNYFSKNERDGWEEIQKKKIKKRQLLNDFLQETEEATEPAKKKKRKKIKNFE